MSRRRSQSEANSKIAFDSISQKFLDAAFDASLWTATMGAVAEYAGANGAVLFSTRHRLDFAPHSASLDDAFRTYIGDGWHLRDERDRGLPLMRRTGCFADQDFASTDEMEHSDYYQGFLAKHSINWSTGVGIRSDSNEWCLVFERGDRQGYFEKDEQARLLRLAEPMLQASRIAHHLAYRSAVGMGDAFDLLGCASILLNRVGKVFRCNASAEKYFGDGLFLRNGELSCATATDSKALREMISSRSLIDSSTSNQLPSSIVIQRPAKPPLVIQAARLNGIASDLFNPATLLLFVVDPLRSGTRAPLHEIKQAYGLTKAESTLLEMLRTDLTLSQAAEQLSISYETVRTQLKSILRRTDAKSQSDLQSLVKRFSLRLK